MTSCYQHTYYSLESHFVSVYIVQVADFRPCGSFVLQFILLPFHQLLITVRVRVSPHFLTLE